VTDDTVGVVNSSTTTTLGEATTGTYSVVLNTQPTGDVTITPASADTDAATVSGAMTFTTANWDRPQTVTVTGVSDDDATNESVTISHTVAGSDYAGVTSPNVTATVTDDETVGVTNSKAAFTLGEEAATDTYTVVLNTQPTGDVTITPVSSDPAAATVSTVMTFTTTDWNQSQTVTVTGVSDADATDESVTISHTIEGNDYDGVMSINVTVTVTDDDTVGVSNSSTTTTLGEATTGTYTVVLNTQPTGDVTITPASADTDAATVSGVMTFTTANWNQAQTVTVTGVNDVDETHESVTISHNIAGNDYERVISADVTATVTDDDAYISETIVFKGLTYLTVRAPDMVPNIWLDRNLGAQNKCVDREDTDCYGDLYQWGSTTPNEIIISEGYDWDSVADPDGAIRSAAWADTTTGTICPIGFRVPTRSELEAWMNRMLYLGSAKALDGRAVATSAFSRTTDGFRGYLWTTTQGSIEGLTYASESIANSTNMGQKTRAWALGVRCIKPAD
jgi:hypothetical protein